MGSKELFLQPILEENLSVVPGLANNISEMTAQLNETTRILMNMMSNQGLELHQEAYSGATFSALTLTNLGESGATGYLSNLQKIYPDHNFNEYIAAQSISDEHGVKIYGDGNTTDIRFSFRDYGEQYFDFRDTEEIQILSVSKNNAIVTDCTFKVYDFDKGQNVTFSGTIATTVDGATRTNIATFEISEENRKFFNGYMQIFFTITPPPGDPGTFEFDVYTPIKIDTDNNKTQYNLYNYPRLVFNSANALTYAADAWVRNAINPQAASAKITLPDIGAVGSWATFLVNGNIEGASLAIVDDTTNDTLVVLPAATSDITSLVQTSNLALKVILPERANVINSIAQRYY